MTDPLRLRTEHRFLTELRHHLEGWQQKVERSVPLAPPAGMGRRLIAGAACLFNVKLTMPPGHPGSVARLVAQIASDGEVRVLDALADCRHLSKKC